MTGVNSNVPNQRTSNEYSELNAEEAIRQYHEWRKRVLGGRVTAVATIEELYARLREEPPKATGETGFPPAP